MLEIMKNNKKSFNKYRISFLKAYYTVDFKITKQKIIEKYLEAKKASNNYKK